MGFACGDRPATCLLLVPLPSQLLRRAAKVINYVLAVRCTSVTTPSCRTFSRARGVFIFVRNFSRGNFLRDSLSKVVEILDPCQSVSRDQIKGAY